MVAVDLAAVLPAGVWGRYSAGRGAKGHRLNDWAMLGIDDPDAPGCCWLLIRRAIGTGDLAFTAPTPAPRCPYPRSWPGAVGPSRNPSKPARASPA